MDTTLKHIKSGAGLSPLEKEDEYNDFSTTINSDKTPKSLYKYLRGFYDGIFCEQSQFELCLDYLKGFYDGVKVRRGNNVY